MKNDPLLSWHETEQLNEKKTLKMDLYLLCLKQPVTKAQIISLVESLKSVFKKWEKKVKSKTNKRHRKINRKSEDLISTALEKYLKIALTLTMVVKKSPKLLIWVLLGTVNILNV